jgi:spore coat polysaccharide biosynthesis protein SpsF (cytidylyltransferase family)
MAQPEIRRQLKYPQKKMKTISKAATACRFQHLLARMAKNSERKATKQMRCASCSREKDKKTNEVCHVCGEYVHNGHASKKILCDQCVD